MAKQIILFNLKDGVKEEEYLKWVREIKGPLQVRLPSGKRFTMLRMLEGMKGDGEKGIKPQPLVSFYKYIVIMDVTSLDAWKKDRKSSQEFAKKVSEPWFTNFVADFMAIEGDELYDKESE